MEITPKVPNEAVLTGILADAWKTHAEYQGNYLQGERHDQWAGWYAAYVLGRLGHFTTPTVLARLLDETEKFDNWAQSAAEHILKALA